MAERGGNVPFHEDVAVPGRAVPRQGYQEHQSPAEEPRADEKENAGEGARKMPTPRRWIGVLVHVESPEFIKASEIHAFWDSNQPTNKQKNPKSELGFGVLKIGSFEILTTKLS